MNSLQQTAAALRPPQVPGGAELAGAVSGQGMGAVSREISDSDLLRRVALGDLEAFGVFYDRHAGVLYALAVKILRDLHEAEEALQEAMVQIWERAPSYDTSLGRPLSWAITVTRNKAIDRLRALQRKSRLVTEAAPEIEAQMGRAEASAEQRAISGETVVLVRQALHALPGEQRQAIELAFLGGLTHSEIAAQLGEALGTIKARIRRGMMALRDVLEGNL